MKTAIILAALAMLTGCAQLTICPEIKLAVCPAQGGGK